MTMLLSMHNWSSVCLSAFRSFKPTSEQTDCFNYCYYITFGYLFNWPTSLELLQLEKTFEDASRFTGQMPFL